MDRDREREAEADSTPPSRADLVRAQLKLIAGYAMLGFAPVVSVAALIVAVIAVTNNQSQSDRVQLNELTSKSDSLNTSLSDAKGELENLKFAMAREKSLHNEERKKLDERDAKIIQNVTRAQVKLKIYPTLEEQLREVASVPVSAPAVASAVSAPVATSAPASASPADKKQVAIVPVSKGTEKTTAQAKALKETIEKFNKK